MAQLVHVSQFGSTYLGSKIFNVSLAVFSKMDSVIAFHTENEMTFSVSKSEYTPGS